MMQGPRRWPFLVWCCWASGVQGFVVHPAQRGSGVWRASESEAEGWTDLCNAGALPKPGETTMLRPSTEAAVALAADKLGNIYALKDKVPPFGHRLSDWGVVDGQVKVVEDAATGNKYYMETGALRRQGARTAPQRIRAFVLRRVLLQKAQQLTPIPWRREPEGRIQVQLQGSSDAGVVGVPGRMLLLVLGMGRRRSATERAAAQRASESVSGGEDMMDMIFSLRTERIQPRCE